MAASGRPMMTLLLVCGLMHIAAAKVYDVGGQSGWTFRSDPLFYQHQFENITLVAGVDFLRFTFKDGQHDVISIPQASLNGCNGSAFGFNNSQSPVTLTTFGPSSWGFMCGVRDHCSKFGMQFNISFVAKESPSSSPADSLFSTSEANVELSHHGEDHGEHRGKHHHGRRYRGEHWASVSPPAPKTFYALDTSGHQLHTFVGEDQVYRP